MHLVLNRNTAFNGDGCDSVVCAVNCTGLIIRRTAGDGQGKMFGIYRGIILSEVKVVDGILHLDGTADVRWKRRKRNAEQRRDCIWRIPGRRKCQNSGQSNKILIHCLRFSEVNNIECVASVHN